MLSDVGIDVIQCCMKFKTIRETMSRLMGKPKICIGEISAFDLATRIVQFLYFLYTKFHASSCLLFLCSPVCVGPVWKPHRWFSHEAAQSINILIESYRDVINDSQCYGMFETGHVYVYRSSSI